MEACFYDHPKTKFTWFQMTGLVQSQGLINLHGYMKGKALGKVVLKEGWSLIWWSFIRVVSRQGGLSSGWSYLGGLSSQWLLLGGFIWVVSHQDGSS